MKQEKHNLPGEEWRDAVVDSGSHGGCWKWRRRWWKNKNDERRGLLWRWTVVDCWLRERDEEKTDCLRVDGGWLLIWGIFCVLILWMWTVNLKRREKTDCFGEMRIEKCLWSGEANRQATPGSWVASLSPASKIVKSGVKSRFYVILRDFTRF